MSAFPAPPRYCPERPLPKAAFVPGRSTRPIASLSVNDDSAGNLRFAVDLFNHGYYWEAHEVWEHEWNVAGRPGPVADILKSLIKLAAAGVKARERNEAGIRRHGLRAIELLQLVRAAWNPAEQGTVVWDWEELLGLARRVSEFCPASDPEPLHPCRLWADVIRWEH